MPYKATIGSVSHGTLQTADLLEALGWELQHLSDATEADKVLANAARERAHHFTWNDLPDGEEVDETEADSVMVNDLVDALNTHAPAFCYFGTHMGDGSDFGFWPDVDSIDELPRVADPADVDTMAGQECVYVNDHGNMTVYSADGAVLWDCV